MQRLKFLLPLASSDSTWFSVFEEARCNFDEPFGVDCTNFSHVLLSRLDEFVVYAPLRTFAKERGARVDENLLVVSNCAIAFRRVFLASVVEEAGSNGLADLTEILVLDVCSAGDHRQLESLHYHQQLLSNILCSLNCASLYEIFVAPCVLVPIRFPCFIYG